MTLALGVHWINLKWGREYWGDDEVSKSTEALSAVVSDGDGVVEGDLGSVLILCG